MEEAMKRVREAQALITRALEPESGRSSKSISMCEKCSSCCLFTAQIVMVVLPNPFRGMRAWRNSTENQQSRATPQGLDQSQK